MAVVHTSPHYRYFLRSIVRSTNHANIMDAAHTASNVIDLPINIFRSIEFCLEIVVSAGHQVNLLIVIHVQQQMSYIDQDNSIDRYYRVCPCALPHSKQILSICQSILIDVTDFGPETIVSSWTCWQVWRIHSRWAILNRLRISIHTLHSVPMVLHPFVCLRKINDC